MFIRCKTVHIINYTTDHNNIWTIILTNGFQPKPTQANNVDSQLLKKRTRTLSTNSRFNLLKPSNTHSWWRSFSPPAILKLVSGTHTEYVLNRDNKHNLSEKCKENSTRRKYPILKKFTLHTEKPTEITYKFIDHNKQKQYNNETTFY